LAPDTAYDVAVEDVTPGLFCVIENGSGVATGDDILDIVVRCQAAVAAPLYPEGSTWLNYLYNDGPSILEASGLACDSTLHRGLRGYRECIHPAEIHTLELPGLSDCTDIRAEDSLGVFEWICDQSSGTVRVVSVGLKSGQGLAQLIEATPGPTWRQISVSVANGRGTFARTTFAQWWDNTLIDVSDLQQQANYWALDAAYAIYILTSSQNMLPSASHYALNYENNHVGFVTLPDAVLSCTDCQINDLLYASGRSFLWTEGTFDLRTVGRVMTFYSHFVTARNVTIIGNRNNYSGNALGFDICGVSHSYFENIVSTNNHQRGLTVNGSWNTHYKNIVSINNGMAGFHIGDTCNEPINNTFENVLVANNDIGVYAASTNTRRNRFINLIVSNNRRGFISSGGNLALNVTLVNNREVGLQVTGTGHTFMNIVAANNDYLNTFSEAGIFFDGAINSMLVDAALAHNSRGIYLQNSTDAHFEGLLKVGDNSVADCDPAVSIRPGIDAGCNNADSSTIAGLISDLDLTNAFVGKVGEDTINTSDVAGVAAFDQIEDWGNFENRWRAWGLDGGDFPSPDHEGECNAGNCRIWDWTLDAGDILLKDVFPLPSGNDLVVHVWDAVDLATCDTVTGASWESNVCSFPGYPLQASCETAGHDWTSPKCVSRILKHAVEITGDLIGNDNGLCESNEDCLYSPNLGGYQGQRELVPAGDFVDGVLTGITLWRFDG
jgi:hypothetical protein